MKPSLRRPHAIFPSLPLKWRLSSHLLIKPGIIAWAPTPRSRLECPASLAKPNPSARASFSPAPSSVQLDDKSSSSRGAQHLEEQIERLIYRLRFMTLLGVFGSLVGSILCYLKGCVYVVSSFAECLASRTSGKVILMLVEAIGLFKPLTLNSSFSSTGVDIYLIGTVMLVFGMGLYELFISNLDIAKTSPCRSNLLGLFMLPERPKWLEIQSVNELKTKLGHVIVLVLLVGLFEKSKKVAIVSPRDLLCFAGSILLSSCGLYLLSKLHSSKQSEHK